MKIEMKDILISIQRALLEKITPNLRSVCVILDNSCIKLVFYFNSPPNEEEKELVSLADTEFISDFHPPEYKTLCEIIAIPFPNKIPDEGFCVFSRYE